jgi:CheY-like chemotaxis protein
METSKRTIVIIGQNTASRRALQLALNLEGYGVHAAESTLEGRRLIDLHWPEAVVLDVADGSPDVLRLARDIRGSRFHRQVVIVAAAPVCLPAQERAAYEAGCDAFVVQPGLSREVAELLEAYLPVGVGMAGVEGDGMQSAKLWN